MLAALSALLEDLPDRSTEIYGIVASITTGVFGETGAGWR